MNLIDVQVRPLYNRSELVLICKPNAIHELNSIYRELGSIDTNAEYELSINKKRRKRSLDANGYYWVLCDKLAAALRMPKYYIHNMLLADYGTDFEDSSGRRQYVLMKDDDTYMYAKEFHVRPTEKVEDRKGTQYRWFTVVKPSHLYDTKEMSRLIDGAVQECKAQRIETLPPHELEEMLNNWRVKK